ncbi:MAG: ATP-binding protein [Chitinophagales bacterium]
MNPQLEKKTISYFNKQIQECKSLLTQQKKDAFPRYQKLYEEAKEANIPIVTVQTQMVMAVYNMTQNDYATAIKKLTATLELAEKHQFLLLIAEVAYKLGFCYYQIGNFSDLTLSLVQKSLAICIEIEEKTATIAACHNRLGSIHRMRSEFDSATIHLKECISLFTKISFPPPIVACYIELSLISRAQSNIAKTLMYIYKGLDLAVEAQHPEGVGECNQQLANIYLYLKDYENSHKYMDKAIEISKKIRTKSGLHLRFNSKGNILQEEGKYGEALDYYQQALAIAKKIKQKDSIAVNQLAIGGMKIEQGELEEAADLLQLALHFFEGNQQPDKVALCYLKQGALFNQLKEYGKAIEVLEKTLLVKELISQKTEVFHQLSIAYEGAGNFAKANEYLKEFIANNKNIYGEKTKELLKMQHQHEMELKEKEKDVLQFKNQELKDLDALKSRFFTNISHELRTPLTLILGPTNDLLQNPSNLEKPQIQQLKTIYRNGRNMLQLVEEVLDLSKLDANKIELEEKRVQIYPIIQRIFHTFQSAAEIKQQRYQLSMWVDKDLTIQIDVSKLEKILNNLLSNAIKYTPDGGEILMSVEEGEGEKLQIKVKDTGRGIHSDDKPHIFKRYFQTQQKDMPTEGGVGVGLAFVKELVELMGGSINVRSKWEKGSIFVLQLPQKQGESVGAAVVGNVIDSVIEDSGFVESVVNIEADLVIPTTNRGSILLVEDHSEMMQYIQSILGSRYKVQTALNGQVAWDILQEDQSFDLIISDVMMPQMDGFTLLEKIKSSPDLLHIPVIMLTARADSKGKLKALTLGVDDYLLKPFIAEELLARINNIIQRQEKKKPKRSTNGEEQTKALKEKRSLSKISDYDLQWLQSAEELVKKHLNDSNFSLSELADGLNFSKRQIQRRIRKVTHLTPTQYIREIKLQTAKESLELGTFQTVAEVAYSVGFDTTHYFSRIYHKRFGKYPSDYTHY